MIYAFGFSICCHLIIVGAIIFAPEYVKEILNRLHKNKQNINKTQVADRAKTIINQDKENKINNNSINKSIDSKNKNTNQEDSETKTNEQIKENDKGELNLEVQKVNTFVKQFIKQPQSEVQMLEWFKDQNYEVTTYHGNYNVTLHVKKPVPSEPTIISIDLDGTVIPSFPLNAAVLKNVYGSTATTGGRVTVVNDGFTTSAFAKYEMGSWWIDITHSFEWDVDKESIKDIWLKAKKIILINDSN